MDETFFTAVDTDYPDEVRLEAWTVGDNFRFRTISKDGVPVLISPEDARRLAEWLLERLS